EEKEGPSGNPSQLLAKAALDSHKITTTTIGIGQPRDPDITFLQQVADAGDGRFYFTKDMFTLPEIFSQESMMVQRYYINEERFTPKLVEGAPLIEDIEKIPDLLGHVATSQKASADVSLISPQEDPVLASWRYGMGQSVAFTSDPTSKWGALWLGWSQYGKFWGRISRMLAQEATARHFLTNYAQEMNRTTIQVEALDDRGEALNQLDLEAVLAGQNGGVKHLPLSQTAPGRYEAVVASQESLLGKIFLINNGAISEEQVIQIPAPPDLESRPIIKGREFLGRAIGPVIDSTEHLKFPTQGSEEVQPAVSALLKIAALLLLFDIAFRKIDFKRILQTKSPVPQPAIPTTSLSSLKHIKQKSAEAAQPLGKLPLEIQVRSESE